MVATATGGIGNGTSSVAATQEPSLTSSIAPTNVVPATTSATAAPAQSSSTANTGIIAGSAVGGAVLVTLLILVALYFMRRNRRPAEDAGPFGPDHGPVGIATSNVISQESSDEGAAAIDSRLNDSPGIHSAPVSSEKIPHVQVAQRNSEEQEENPLEF